MKKKCWLITGGAGFIGSNLINHLIKNNQKVICIDNFINGSLKNFENIISKNLLILK